MKKLNEEQQVLLDQANKSLAELQAEQRCRLEYLTGKLNEGTMQVATLRRCLTSLRLGKGVTEETTKAAAPLMEMLDVLTKELDVVREELDDLRKELTGVH